MTILPFFEHVLRHGVELRAPHPAELRAPAPEETGGIAGRGSALGQLVVCRISFDA